MRLALCQPVPTDGVIETAFARLDQALSAAAAAGADMLLLPELFLPGYNRPDLHDSLAQPADGPWLDRVAGMARQAGCGVTLGWAERAEGRLFNSAVCFGPDGALLAHYRKLQLFGEMERTGFTAGTGYCLFALGDRIAALLICFDVEYPEHARALAAAGAELLLVPTANPTGYPHVADLIVPARAAENGLTVAYANYCGEESGLEFDGGSVIAGPDGQALARAGAAPALLVVDLPASGAGGRLGLATRPGDTIAPA
ncbi:nitrilase-related carbon-nitrogen hydrolase [Tropicimonas sp. IMCC34043]|uniref:nitrilase-related carbon-nitrogen hydrolase n=1 Tax=Tropicimonas sp. IMCC34043 TaxID=2248760 RepID=UPI000E236127|nr:nitrilase-related carbon-nitrogen hydrolase [Tropicimonas sp. IMCC34043]